MAEQPERCEDNAVWNDAAVQFPRLIAEINAVGLTHEQVQGLCESMDITVEQLNDLCERANTLWELEKARTLESTDVYVECPSCGHGHLFFEAVDEDNWARLTCLNCERDWAIDEDGFVRGL